MKIQNPKFHPTATGRYRNYKNGNEGTKFERRKIYMQEQGWTNELMRLAGGY
jgi:hypothetical protein